MPEELLIMDSCTRKENLFVKRINLTPLMFLDLQRIWLVHR